MNDNQCFLQQFGLGNIRDHEIGYQYTIGKRSRTCG